jgi:type I restriction enzyme M protein
MLKALDKGCHPKEVIAKLGESLLSHYEEKPLINAYDAYQHLMDYWAATMQDDLYLIAADGWKAETYRIIETDKKGKQRDKGWACDLSNRGKTPGGYAGPDWRMSSASLGTGAASGTPSRSPR